MSVLVALGSALLIGGLALVTIGLIGLLRRRDIFEQLHAAGLVTGPGVILVLLGSIATGRVETITSAVLVVFFVLVTGSLSTHAIALAAWRRRQAGFGAGGAPAVHAHRRPSATVDQVGVAGGPMRILVAHDGSRQAGMAVRLAAALAVPAGSRLRLVGVAVGSLPSVEDAGPDGAPPRGRHDLVAALDEALAAVQRPGITVDRVARTGQPAAAIADEAAAFGAELVIVGSRGLGRLRSLLTGSVARQVVDRAPCPVLVARSASVRVVVLAADGSPSSEAAIRAVATWPLFEDVAIHVLAVGGAEAQAVAEQIAERLAAAGRPARPAGRLGDPATAILTFAEAASADLIVLGSRGRTGVGRALLGSVGAEVLVGARTSVLVVPGLER
jgi:monovalent cation/proton antiporter MnhG/PhaG subunit